MKWSKRCCLQYSLRTLFVATAILAACCAQIAVRAHRSQMQANAVKRLSQAGAFVFYDFQDTHNGQQSDLSRQPPAPKVLRSLLGEHFFAHAISLSATSAEFGDRDLANVRDLPTIRSINLGDSNITGEGLRHLRSLGDLEELGLSRTRVNNAGLRHLTALKTLQKLSLADTQVGDAGVSQLCQLKQLRSLSILGTRITVSGLDRLRAELPNTWITHAIPAKSDFCESEATGRDSARTFSSQAQRIETRLNTMEICAPSE